MGKYLPIVGISMGDPAGIGAEVTVKALQDVSLYEICRPFVVGDLPVLEDAARQCGIKNIFRTLSIPSEGEYVPGIVNVMDLGVLKPGEHHYKTVSAPQGRAAYEYVAKNIALALERKCDATVTGPINKAALNMAGLHYAGHTEIYADLTKTKDYAMMLALDGFRVVHVSTHVSLREACDRVKKDRILNVIELSVTALDKLGIKSPRIAVAGLNPHSGEGGLFGNEEKDEIIPAIEVARAKGLDVTGPVPPDTVFTKMAAGGFDIVVVMYHDQGHIPLKMKGFRFDESTGRLDAVAGVNITLGLPIVRVSVDHGTAFEIAGEGRANPDSMIDSIRLAAWLSTK